MKIEMESMSYLELPTLRFIGKDVIASGEKAGEKYGEMWGRSGEFMPVLENMKEALFEGIDVPCALMHHNNQTAKEQMHYLVGRFMKADTPVPEGFDFYDTPAATVALAVYRGEFDDLIAQSMMATYEKFMSDGYRLSYPEGYFHAEVYLRENVPESGAVSKLAYLMTCEK